MGNKQSEFFNLPAEFLHVLDEMSKEPDAPTHDFERYAAIMVNQDAIWRKLTTISPGLVQVPYGHASDIGKRALEDCGTRIDAAILINQQIIFYLVSDKEVPENTPFFDLKSKAGERALQQWPGHGIPDEDNASDAESVFSGAIFINQERIYGRLSGKHRRRKLPYGPRSKITRIARKHVEERIDASVLLNQQAMWQQIKRRGRKGPQPGISEACLAVLEKADFESVEEMQKELQKQQGIVNNTHTRRKTKAKVEVKELTSFLHDYHDALEAEAAETEANNGSVEKEPEDANNESVEGSENMETVPDVVPDVV